jgi:peroxiredoxin
VRGRYDEIRSMGAEVLVVSFEPVERLPAYRALHGWPFPVVSDPDRAAYRAFGLGSAGWSTLLRPRVMLRYAALLLQGYRQRTSDEDVHQLGGDFVLDADRRVAYAHRSTDPVDRPPAGDLVEVVRRLTTKSQRHKEEN